MKVRSPVTWFGGKSRLASKIIAQFPEHHTYCEVFGGSGAVLLAKEPSKVEVFNDVDDSLVNLFRVLRDSELCRQLQRACESTLYARASLSLRKSQPTIRWNVHVASWSADVCPGVDWEKSGATVSKMRKRTLRPWYDAGGPASNACLHFISDCVRSR